MHLIIDGKAGNSELMVNPDLMREWLQRTVRLIGMTPFGEPYIQGYPWPGSTDSKALTAFQPLKESGLSIHCYPEREYVFIDLFSCVGFDVNGVVSFIMRSFQMCKAKVLVLDRGVEHGMAVAATLKDESEW